MGEAQATSGGGSSFVSREVRSWRLESRDSSETQMFALGLLLTGISLTFTTSLWLPGWIPLAAYFVWLLLATILLKFGPLVVAVVWNGAAALASTAVGIPVVGPRAVAVAMFLLGSAVVLFQASFRRSGRPMPVSEAVFTDLRDRLEREAQVPDLPSGWHAQSAMTGSHGGEFAGDLVVTHLSDDGRQLEVIVADVVVAGPTAGPAALEFAGCLGGLLGKLPPAELFRAANDFLLRQNKDAEQFATAVHLIVDLEEGSYAITSAGHPPALRYDLPSGGWVIENARGTSLGVLKDPDLHRTTGRLFPGEALMFYTDGVVEARTARLDSGISWLQHTAREAVSDGFPGVARRLIGHLDSGDDGAVLILSRDPVATTTEARDAEVSSEEPSRAHG